MKLISEYKMPVTSAVVQPGGRFVNADLLLCQCRRKLLREQS
jgi:hypothetical protein